MPLGLVSGYLGGWLDRVLVLVMDALYAFPSLLLAIVVSIVLSGGNSGAFGGIMAAAISITVVFIPQYFRVIRNATIAVKAEPYVDAARVVGARTPRILKHIFSNVTSSLPVIGTLNASEAILTLAGLGFLGFGIEPSAAAEWGYDLNKALPDASSGIWWTGVFPGTAIVLIVLGTTLVGESLNDILNPLLRTRAGSPPADEKEIEYRVRGARRGRRSIEVPSCATEPMPKTGRDPGLRDLTVDFSTDGGTVHAVDGISFDVAPGEVLAVVGESGSGKSVSSRAMLGLLPQTAAVTGSAHAAATASCSACPRTSCGRSVATRSSMVFQEPSTALNPVFTVGWQIIEGLRAHTTSPRRTPGREPSSCSTWSACPIPSTASTTTRTSSPAARSNASSSRWRSRATPTSSSPTSRPPRSTSPCRPRSSSCCCRCATGSAPRSC